MISTLFVAAFIGSLFLCLRLLRYAGLSVTRFSLPSLLIIFFIVAAYIGVLPLYFGWDAGRASIGVVDRQVILMIFLFNSVVLFVLICGFVFSHQFLGMRAHPVTSACPRGATMGERLFFVGVLGLSLLVLLLYLWRVPDIALAAALRGDLPGAAIARSSMGNAFPGTYWRYQLFFHTMLFFSCAFFLADRQASGSRSSLLALWLAVPFAVFASVMAIEKGPIIGLLMVLYLVYALSRGGAYWQPALKWSLMLGTGLLVGMYMLFMGVTEPASGLASLLSRVFTGSISPAYFYLEIFPTQIDYLYGRSFPNPGDILPFENFPLTREVMMYIYPEAYRLGIVGSAPTVFWAELYANFGPLGVVAAPFLVGIIVYFVQHVVSAIAMSPTIAAATVMLAVHFKDLAVSSLSSYLFDTVFFAIVLVAALALLARRFPEAVGEHFARKARAS